MRAQRQARRLRRRRGDEVTLREWLSFYLTCWRTRRALARIAARARAHRREAS